MPDCVPQAWPHPPCGCGRSLAPPALRPLHPPLGVRVRAIVSALSCIALLCFAPAALAQRSPIPGFEVHRAQATPAGESSSWWTPPVRGGHLVGGSQPGLRVPAPGARRRGRERGVQDAPGHHQAPDARQPRAGGLVLRLHDVLGLGALHPHWSEGPPRRAPPPREER